MYGKSFVFTQVLDVWSFFHVYSLLYVLYRYGGGYCPGVLYGGYCPGVIVRGLLSGGLLSGGYCPGVIVLLPISLVGHSFLAFVRFER